MKTTSNGKPSRRKTKTKQSQPPPGPRTVERSLTQLARAVVQRGETLPQVARLDMAQQLVHQAWETPSPRRRVELAQQAIAISADCADAYLLLAEFTGNLAEARDLHQKAMLAGERALGQRAFAEDVGHFWGLLETRPYMRARAGLASCLWHLGDLRGAIEHYQAMLRLNPNDNQGLRYVLVGCLLATDQDEAAERLLAQYEDEGAAAWVYSAALLAYRKHGDTSESREKRGEALKANPFVWPFLLGRRPISKHLPDLIGYGDESEAVAYAADHKAAWKKAPGAIAWLCSAAREPQSSRNRR